MSQTWILTGSLQLAFQGQLRAVSDADGELLRERISAAAALRAPA